VSIEFSHHPTTRPHIESHPQTHVSPHDEPPETFIVDKPAIKTAVSTAIAGRSGNTLTRSCISMPAAMFLFVSLIIASAFFSPAKQRS